MRHYIPNDDKQNGPFCQFEPINRDLIKVYKFLANEGMKKKNINIVFEGTVITMSVYGQYNDNVPNIPKYLTYKVAALHEEIN